MLESEIRVEPFTRHGRRTNELNQFGTTSPRVNLTAQCSLETAVSAVRGLTGRRAGTITLGFPSSLGSAIVPGPVRCHGRYPEARFELRQGRRLMQMTCPGVCVFLEDRGQICRLM